MNIILLSGGSGKRLWPLSNDVRSKQFIKILKNDKGILESMVQRVYRQILSCDKNANITIATSEAQIPVLRNQLGDNIDISVEPCRKDTFPAIVLSCLYLKFVKKLSDDSKIIVLPVDPYVKDDYFIAIKKLYDTQDFCDSNIGLLGVKPTYPSEKYGYVLPSKFDTNLKAFFVDKFVEKPNKEDAEKYIKLGALWNAGVFCFKLSFIINKAHEMYDFIDYNDFFEKYNSLNKISFDYAVMEKEKSIFVMKYEGEWKDIGTWGTLTSVLSDSVIGNAMIDEKSVNTNILNQLSIPIIGMGLNNLIIAASPDGIFVSDKEESSYNKKMVDEITNRPMYEERLWGEYIVLEQNKDGYLTKHLKIYSGKNISYQLHHFRDEIWTIVKGHGVFVLDGERKDVTKGDVLFIPKHHKHALKAVDELEFIEVQIGNYLEENDIEHFSYDF